MTNELIKDLYKAGEIIRQYQKFHHDLKKTTYKPIPKLDHTMPETIDIYRIDKNDYEIFQKLKLMISDFEIKY